MQNVDSIFHAAVKKPARERQAFLEKACGEDSELRARVERLLSAHSDAGSLLESPAPELGATVHRTIVEQAGSRIGPYKLLQQIGEGGMGVVYMAEQEKPVRRVVALKIIKPGMDSVQVIARFEAERQALSMMDHQHIAKVLDAGTTETDRPYFAMELVKGVPITEYCDHNKLTPRDRLEMFVPVCQAIQHAHQKGIIHRDIKPSNVLVTLYDGKPVPKVIDFGIAKATQQKLTERTMFTGIGQILGTLEYMSPEQAEVNQLDVDTRSDVYSLGVVLYELLTGSTPISKDELGLAGLEEMLRTIRETDPPKPSTRLSKSGSAVPTISQVRGTEPTKLSKFVRGDLDWIVMKALEKDRTRRYETANGLAMDIQRFLDDEAVQACPPSLGYKTRKFIRRNRGLFATAAVFLLVVCLGLIGTSLGLAWAMHERNNAREGLYNALVGEARASRIARQPGFRTAAWQRLSRALDLPVANADRQQIRQEAVACLGDFVGLPPKIIDKWVRSISLDETGRQFVIWQNNGTISVRDVLSGEGLSEFKETEQVGSVHFATATEIVTVSENQLSVWSSKGQGWKKEWKQTIDGARTAVGTAFSVEHIPTAITPDRKRLAIVEDNLASVSIWDLAERKKLASIDVDGKVRSVALGPNAERLVLGYGSEESKVEIRDLRSGSVDTLSADFGRVYSTRISDDGSLLAVAFQNGVILYETTGLKRLFARRGYTCESVAFSPTESHIAIGTKTQGIVLLSFAGMEVARIPYASTAVCIAFSKDGEKLIAGGNDAPLHIFPIATEEKIDFKGHNSVNDVAFTPDGSRIVSIGWDRLVKVWDARSGELLRAFDRLKGRGQCHALGPRGRLLATGERLGQHSGAVWLWDLETGERLLEAEQTCGNLLEVAFSPDGRYFACCGKKGIHLWEVEGSVEGETLSLKVIEVPERSAGDIDKPEVLAVTFSPDSKLLAWIRERRIRLWDIDEKQEIDAPTDELVNWWPYQGVSFIADHRIVFAVDVKDDTNVCKIWDINTGQLLEFPITTQHGSGCTFMHPSPDGRWLATQTPSKTAVDLWDLRRGQQLLTLPERASEVWAIDWSHDGNRLAVGRSDGEIEVWDLPTVRAQLAELKLDW